MDNDYIPDKTSIIKAFDRLAEELNVQKFSSEEYDQIFKFVELRQTLIDKINNDSFATTYLTDLLFNRLTPEGKKNVLKDLEQEINL